MNLPDNLPPLPPESCYGGLLKDQTAAVYGWVHGLSDVDLWIGPCKWVRATDPAKDVSADWHVALPIEAVRDEPEQLHAPGDPSEWMSEPATGIEAKVCADIAARQRVGIAKYGVTLAGNDLELRARLQHAYEECLDQACYLKWAMEKLP